MTSNSTAHRLPLHPDLSFGTSTPEAQWEPLAGVPVSMRYVTGYLTSADGRRSWMAMRSTLPTTARKLTVLEMAPGTHFEGPLVCAEAYGGAVEADHGDGVWSVVRRPDGTHLIETTETTLGWHEDGLLDVTGTLIGAPPMMFVPSAEMPMGYAIRWFSVEGTVGGEEVSGTACLDSVHLHDGQALFPSPYTGDAQIAWAEFCTEYEDGTADCGALLVGRQGFSAMLVLRSDGSTLATTDVSAEFETDGGDPEFLTTARFSGGGEVWVVDALPKAGHWPIRTDLPDEHRLMQITARRVGDDRPVRRSTGLLENYQRRI